MWLIEAFFLHWYEFAEVYAVLAAWMIIPQVYLLGMLWLQRNGGVIIDLSEKEIEDTGRHSPPVVTPSIGYFASESDEVASASASQEEKAVGTD